MSTSGEQECPVCDGDGPVRDRLLLAAKGEWPSGVPHHVHRVVVDLGEPRCPATVPMRNSKNKVVETTSRCDLMEGHDGPHHSTLDVTWETT